MLTGVPATIEGKEFVVTKLTIGDINLLDNHLRCEARKAGHASMPEGLSDEELRRWIKLIREDADTLSVFNDEGKALLDLPANVPIQMWCRVRRSGVTLQWCQDLFERANSGDESARSGLRDLNAAILLADGNSTAKKNEQPVPTTTDPLTSGPPSSESPNGTVGHSTPSSTSLSI